MEQLTEEKVRNMIREEMASAAQKAQYSVTRVPVHVHNNIDSPNVPATNVGGFLSLSAVDDGVLDPTNLGNRTAFWEQVTLDGGQSNIGNRSVIPVFPVPIISGDTGAESLPFLGGDAPDGTLLLYKGADYWQLWGMFFGTWRGVGLYLPPGEGGELHTGTLTEETNGTTLVEFSPNFSFSIIGVYLISQDTTAGDIDLASSGDYTLTGGLSGGATSATLSSNWVPASGTYQTVFSDGTVKAVSYTQGMTGISWTGGLPGAVTSAITTYAFPIATIAKGTVSGAMIGATGLTNTTFTYGNSLSLISSSSGNAQVFVLYSIP